MQTGPSRAQSTSSNVPPRYTTWPRCPKCRCAVTIESYSTEEGRHWDVVCPTCGQCVAFWRSGDEQWTELFTSDGLRLTGPIGGLPEPPDPVGCPECLEVIGTCQHSCALALAPDDPGHNSGAPTSPAPAPPRRRGRPRGTPDRNRRQMKTPAYGLSYVDDLNAHEGIERAVLGTDLARAGDRTIVAGYSKTRPYGHISLIDGTMSIGLASREENL